jgi:dynactin complex subunit
MGAIIGLKGVSTEREAIMIAERIVNSLEKEIKEIEEEISQAKTKLTKPQLDAVNKAEGFGWRFYGIHRTNGIAYLSSRGGKKMGLDTQGQRVKV